MVSTIRLLRMPSGVHQCLVYSLAMLLDEDVDVLIQELGHDGMVKDWPEHPIPHCYNGHHIQEIIDLVLARGYSLTPIESYPRYASAMDPSNWKPVYSNGARFLRQISGRRGILIGQYRGRGHAVAWDGDIIWDPNGKTYGIGDFAPSECWLLDITSQKRSH